MRSLFLLAGMGWFVSLPVLATDIFSRLDLLARTRPSSPIEFEDAEGGIPIYFTASLDAANTPYFSRVGLNAEVGAGDIGYTTKPQRLVLNQAYVQTKYFLDDKVSLYLGRQMMLEGFDLFLMDGAKADYHLTPNILVTAYSGTAIYDDANSRNAVFTKIYGTRVSYYNDSDFAASAAVMNKMYKKVEPNEKIEQYFLGSNSEKTFFADKDMNIRIYYNVEASASRGKLCEAIVGSDISINQYGTFGLSYGVFQDYYNYFSRSEFVQDFFNDGQVRQIRGTLALKLPYAIRSSVSYGRLYQDIDGLGFSHLWDFNIAKSFDSFIVDRAKFSISSVINNKERLDSNETKIMKSIIQKKLDVDVLYAQDRYHKLSGIYGAIEAMELGSKYHITDKFDARLAVAYKTGPKVSHPSSGVLHLSYYNF